MFRDPQGGRHGFSLETSVPAITVFIQGLLSFFSPCVLPLIPLYVGYLAGGTAKRGEDGTFEYPRVNVLMNTVFFVVGVSFAFFLLGFGFTALGQFFTGNQRLFSILAGLVMAAFGLYMLGAFGKARAIETQRRLPFRLDRFAMNPLVALVLGFTFSFAWDAVRGPGVGECAAHGVVERFRGYGVSARGRVHPRVRAAVLGGGPVHGRGAEVLQVAWQRGEIHGEGGRRATHRHGIMTITGWMNGVTSYLSSFGAAPAAQEQPADQGTADGDSKAGSGSPDSDAGSAGQADSDVQQAPLVDLVLVDQTAWSIPCRTTGAKRSS